MGKINFEKLFIFITLILVMVIYSEKLVDGNNLFIYISTIYGLIYSCITLPKLIKNYNTININKWDKILSLFIVSYLVYINIQYIFINTIYYKIILQKSILLVSVLIFIVKIRIDNTEKMLMRFLVKTSVILTIVFFVSAVVGVNMSFSSKDIIEISSIDPKKGLEMWFLHKSKLASFCILMIGVIQNYTFKKNIHQYILLLMNIFVIYKSKSATALALAICCIFIVYSTKIIINMKKEYKNKVLLAISAASIVIVGIVFNYINTNKSIMTLGDRTNIWEAIFPTIINNPFGVGSTHSYTFIVRNSFNVTSAHNIFLQEMLENGYISAIMFMAIFIIIGIALYKNNKIYFLSFSACVVMANMDITIVQDFYNIFFVFAAVMYCEATNEIICKEGGIK